MSKASRDIESKIAGAVAATVGRTDVPADIPSIAPITEAVSREIIPELLHATNNEPFVKSWVSMGSSSSIVGALYLFGYTVWKTGDLPGPEVAVPALMILSGALSSLWGRWMAKRPIGG